MRIYVLTTIVALVMLGACCSPKVITYEKVVVRDSIVERLRDTTIYVTLEKLVNSHVQLCTDTSYLENKLSTSAAWVENDLLHHTLEQKQQELPFTIKYVDKYHTIVRDSLINHTQVVEVNKLTRWQSFRLVLADILGGALVFGLLLLIIKNKILS